MVLASLPTPAAVERVALGSDGVIGGAKVRIFIDLSTSGPDAAKSVAKKLAERKIVAFDAPVSGGVHGAGKGALTVMAAGPKATYDEIEPLLRCFGKSVFYVGGEPGMGQVMKLINNLLSAAAFTATAEAMVMGVKAGLDASQMIEVLNTGTGRNSATQDKFPHAILSRTFHIGAATSVMIKDVSLCMEHAARLGLKLSLAQPMLDLWGQVAQEQGADSDYSEIVKMLERRAGVEVKA